MNIKKIIALLCALVTVLSVAGCMPSSNTRKVQTVTDPAASADEIAFESYDNSLKGLCKYLAALGYAYDFSAATGDESDPVVMRAQMIGADEGYKFTYVYNGKTTVLELYSYTDTTNKFYKQAESEGKITVSEELDIGTVDVVLSDNGKYLMIYNDEANNAERQAAVTEAFKGFYK